MKQSSDTVLKWKLNDIVSIKEFNSLYSDVERSLGKYDSYYLMLKPDMPEKDFIKFIKFNELIKEKISRLGYRAFLMDAEDQKSQQAKLMKNRERDLEIRFNDVSRKIWHWIKGKKVDEKPVLDKKNAKRLFNSIGDLKYILNYERDFAKHNLKISEESIISNKDMNGISALNDLRTLIETEFEYDFNPKGGRKRKKNISQSELVSYVYSSNRENRKAAYEMLLKKYRENIDKLFIIYQAIVKDWVYDSRLRKFNSPISVRNKYNHIPDSAVSTLIEVCAANREVFWKYFRYKKKELGLKNFERWDIYAPIKETNAKISFSKAINIVLDTLKGFNPEFAIHAKSIIDSKHIDSHSKPNKVSGAFCATVSPKIIPYILLNYTGKYRDVLTLAHELGHGIHSLYARKHSISAQDANLPLSETASTFCEMIVFERLYAEAKNVNTKKWLLADRMANSYATILRQNYFVKFELEAHNMISKGITSEGLSGIYYNNLKEQFGSAVKIDPIFRYEWAYIPHIVHTPFYCYAYNFGELLSLALYSAYKKHGNKIIRRIEKILSYGGSENPQMILKESGFDITDSSFWQGSFDIIKKWQKELESL